MNIIYFIAMIVLFPLNTLLFFPANIPQEKSITVTQDEEIQGAEKLREDQLFSENFFPASQFKPVKKEGMPNLAVPNAHAAIILDVDSGTILYDQNGNEQRQIASLTKMMTAVLTLEKVKNLDEEAAVSAAAVYIDGTKVGCPRSGYCPGQRFRVGEKVAVRDLLKAMLMNSANDAAVALAEHMSGTEEEFVKLMNSKAEDLKLNNSHFCTASGLEIDGRESECYSSAYDIARIAAYAMRYSLIWDIFRLPNNTTITSTDGTCSHDILNTDIVLNEIPNCLGGKTGFTPLAGRSLMIAASDESKKHKIIAVILDDPYRWQDIRTMISWAFKTYEWQ